MIEIKKISVKPSAISIEPELLITIHYSWEGRSKLPVKFVGFLFFEGSRIAVLHEDETGIHRHEVLHPVSYENNTEQLEEKSFVAPLSEKAFQFINNKLSKNPDADLNFDAALNFSFIEPLFDAFNTGEIVQPFFISVQDRSMLKFQSYDFTEKIAITKQDWIQNFVSVFDSLDSTR